MKILPTQHLMVLMIVFTLFSAIFLNTVTAYGFLKITSPSKGQKVPLGRIVISGTSSSNSTNHCSVAVSVNKAKPFQQTVATGHGSNDYSTWNFTSEDNAIKQGLNLITSKYSCPNSFSHYYSLNVTGVQGTGIGEVQGQQNKVPSITNNVAPGLFPGQ